MRQISTEDEVRAAERTLSLAWVIVAGAVLFSVLTVTPLVQQVTPDPWDWTAPILPVVVDAAVIIVVRIDAIIARLGGRPGGWSAFLRWLTGALTLALNVGHSALAADWVGVGVHAVAPALLIVTAEATLTYRRAITAAVEQIERERAAEREQQAREQREREERARADREREREARQREQERAEAAERERRREEAAEREREREHAAQLAREQREAEVRRIEAERERDVELERLRIEEAARQRREAAERQAADQRRREDEQRRERERQERDRKAREAARRAAASPAPAASVSAAVSTPRPAVSATVS
ncbi:SpdB, partial [Streptomyces thermolilacinus]